MGGGDCGAAELSVGEEEEEKEEEEEEEEEAGGDVAA